MKYNFYNATVDIRLSNIGHVGETIYIKYGFLAYFVYWSVRLCVNNALKRSFPLFIREVNSLHCSSTLYIYLKRLQLPSSLLFYGLLDPAQVSL